MSFLRRGPIEIMLDLIKYSQISINKTKLMNKANLAHKPFEKYMDYLEKMEFIMKIPPPPLTGRRGNGRAVKFHYIITMNGNELLNQLTQDPLSELLAFRSFDIMEEIS